MISSPVATVSRPPTPVLDVHRVVLPVVAPEAEEDRRPLALAQALLLERPVEDELAADQLVVAALLLRAPRSRTPGSAARRRPGAARASASRRAPAAARRRHSRRRAASTTRRRTRPVNASLEPSPRTSTPALQPRAGPDSSSRATTICTGSSRRISVPPTGVPVGGLPRARGPARSRSRESVAQLVRSAALRASSAGARS